MVLVDNDTISAVHHRFQTEGRDGAMAELRRRFWLLDDAANDTIERLLKLPRTGTQTKQ